MQYINTLCKKYSVSICSIILCLLAVGGCGPNSPQTTAAHKISDALPTIIGPAHHYDVHVDGDSFAIARGHVRHVTIEGDNVDISPSLQINKLNVDAEDLSLNLHTKKVENAGKVDIQGAVGQLNLDKYLAAHKPIDGLQVQIRWTDLEVTIPVSAGKIETVVKVDGNLAPGKSGSDKLDFVPSSAQISIVPIPKRILNIAMDRVNPVLDMSSLKFPITIHNSRVDKGRIYFQASTTLKEK